MERYLQLGRKNEEKCQLSFVISLQRGGGVYAKIKRADIDKNIDRWSNTLVGYVSGDKPFNSHLKIVLKEFGSHLALLKSFPERVASFSSLEAKKNASVCVNEAHDFLMGD